MSPLHLPPPIPPGTCLRGEIYFKSRSWIERARSDRDALAERFREDWKKDVEAGERGIYEVFLDAFLDGPAGEDREGEGELERVVRGISHRSWALVHLAVAEPSLRDFWWEGLTAVLLEPLTPHPQSVNAFDPLVQLSSLFALFTLWKAEPPALSPTGHMDGTIAGKKEQRGRQLPMRVIRVGTEQLKDIISLPKRIEPDLDGSHPKGEKEGAVAPESDSIPVDPALLESATDDQSSALPSQKRKEPPSQISPTRRSKRRRNGDEDEGSSTSTGRPLPSATANIKPIHEILFVVRKMLSENAFALCPTPTYPDLIPSLTAPHLPKKREEKEKVRDVTQEGREGASMDEERHYGQGGPSEGVPEASGGDEETGPETEGYSATPVPTNWVQDQRKDEREEKGRAILGVKDELERWSRGIIGDPENEEDEMELVNDSGTGKWEGFGLRSAEAKYVGKKSQVISSFLHPIPPSAQPSTSSLASLHGKFSHMTREAQEKTSIHVKNARDHLIKDPSGLVNPSKNRGRFLSLIGGAQVRNLVRQRVDAPADDGEEGGAGEGEYGMEMLGEYIENLRSLGAGVDGDGDTAGGGGSDEDRDNEGEGAGDQRGEQGGEGNGSASASGGYSQMKEV